MVTTFSLNNYIFALILSVGQVAVINSIAFLGSDFGSALNPAIALGVTICIASEGRLRSYRGQSVFFLGPLFGGVLGMLFFENLYRKHVLLSKNSPGYRSAHNSEYSSQTEDQTTSQE
jgi:glycerol uptake facilitator-like aquaporin